MTGDATYTATYKEKKKPGPEPAVTGWKKESGSWYFYDKNGNTLKLAKGYVYLDYKANEIPITSSFDYLGSTAVYYLKLSGANPDKRLTTSVKDNEGYYTIFVWKK